MKKFAYLIGAIFILAVVIIATIYTWPESNPQTGTQPTPAPAPSPAATETSSVPQPSDSATSVSDETIEMHEELLEVIAENGETQTSPFYKTGTNSGEMVYWVCRSSDTQMMALPVNETVIYEVDGNDHHMERVSFSYTQGEETVSLTQYRLFVPSSTS